MNGKRHTTARRLTAGASLGAVALAVACAREEPPPGSRLERIPPSVIELNPTLNEIVPGFGGSAEIRFDEPISGARNLEQSLVASPAARYQVSAGFSNLKIKPREGWLDGAVYYIEIPAGIADLLGNRTEDPIELVFSTGPQISGTRVTGDVSRRLDASAVTDGRLLFFNVAGDSIPYSAVADRAGEFRLPHLPPDDYWAFAFEDFNRNLQLERQFEPYDSTRFALVPDGAASLSFRIVDPDSTPPLLVKASAQDSQSLRLEFDDFLDPDQDFSAISVRVRTVAGGVRDVSAVRLEDMPQSGRGGSRGRAGEARPQDDDRVPSRRRDDDDDEDPLRQLEAPPDTAAGDGGEPGEGVEPEEGAERDTLAVTGDTILAAELGAEVAEEEEGPPLPSQWLRIELAAPLQDGAYEISIDRVLNLRHLAGSADTTFVYPEPPDSEQAADDEVPAPGAPEEEEIEPPRRGEVREEPPP